MEEIQIQQCLLPVEVQDGCHRRGALLHFPCILSFLRGCHLYLNVFMPKLSHEEFHEEEGAQEDEVEVVPYSYDGNAKYLFKTLHQTKIGDISMAVELFVDLLPGNLDHVHHHAVHGE